MGELNQDDNQCTTIMISKETRKRLAAKKEYARESYDETVNKLITISDTLEEGLLSIKTKKDLEIAREQIRKGKGITTKELLAKLGM